MHRILFVVLLSLPSFAFGLELTETLQFPESHSVPWIRNHARPATAKPEEWPIDPEVWKQAVAQKGEGKKEDVIFQLWIPDGLETVKGIVAISGHGSGEALYKRADLRQIATELHLALFKFTGNPMQRGFWPTTLLDDRLRAFGEKSQHPELIHAPLFLYGHSNATGFSAIFPNTQSARVWAWVSMRPGTATQILQPGGAPVPGMIMFGENDKDYFQKDAAARIATVETMRKNHHARWHAVVEAAGGHGPNEKSWTLVFSFLRHTFAARVPADSDPRKGPVTLRALAEESGYLGTNWDVAKGGLQELPIAPFAAYAGDKAIASWLLNAEYAADWVAFQRDGVVK